MNTYYYSTYYEYKLGGYVYSPVMDKVLKITEIGIKSTSNGDIISLKLDIYYRISDITLDNLRRSYPYLGKNKKVIETLYLKKKEIKL